MDSSLRTQRPAPTRAVSRIVRPGVAALCLLAAIMLGACGGGGGGGSGPEPLPPEIPLSGISGYLHFPDVHLGRVAEQEPNDSAAQASPLPPAFARSTLEATGELGTTAEEFGRVDLVDAVRFVATEHQAVTLGLTYRNVGGGAEVDLRVFETESGDPVALTAGGPQPRTTTFTAIARTSYDVVLTIASGHAAWVLRFDLADLNLSVLPTVMDAPLLNRASAPPAVTAYTEDEPPCAPTHLLVRFEDESQATRVCEAHALSPIRRLASGTWKMGFECEDAAHGRRKALALCASISDEQGVRFAEPDWIVKPLGQPNDPDYPRQWNMRSVGAESAWDLVTGDPGIVVGVVDTGILAHPDLTGRVVQGYDFISEPAVGGDGDGRDPDPTDEGDQLLSSGMSSWHGTHVAGIVVANQNDGYGVTGIAPGCRVMPLRALGIGGGLVSDVSAAILYSAGLISTDHGPALPAPLSILNLSVGLTLDSAELSSACERAGNTGMFIVGATGNSGQAVLFPARYPSVFAVGAVDARLLAARYSNFGPEVQLAAPGGSLTSDVYGRGASDGIYSTVKNDFVFPSQPGHVTFQGTSSAAPHVAGAAALLLSMAPQTPAPDIAAILRATALDIGIPGQDNAHGAGLLQVHRAVNALAAGLGTPRSDGPWLLLSTPSVRLRGVENQIEVQLFNGGSGQLAITGSPSFTDDGAAWLSARIDFNDPTPDVATPKIIIDVERQELTGTGVFSGTVRLTTLDGVQGAIRVVVYAGLVPRAGRLLQAAMIEDGTGIARAVSLARPERNYQFRVTGLPSAFYRVRGGEDLDEDLFFCEPGDTCAWFGGATEAEATLVFTDITALPVTGIDFPITGP